MKSILERPDSRSTDEDISRNPSPPLKVTPPSGVLKSSSTGRMPRTNWPSRSASCDRSSGRRISRTNVPNSRLYPPPVVQANGFQINRSASNHSATGVGTPGPAAKPQMRTRYERSLSAGGTADFFGGSRSTSQAKSANNSVRMPRAHGTPTSSSGNISMGTGKWGGGKNTWNGSPMTAKHKVRPNLFHAEYNGQSSCSMREDENLPDSGLADSSGNNAGLAECIRKALTLESNEEKIYHIEQFIKSYEQQRQHVTQESPSALSLPYDNSGCSLFPRTVPVLAARRRKFSGNTRIPQPNFY